MDMAILLILVVATTVTAATGFCPPGQHVLEDRCRDCDRGTFSSDGQCERCAAGFYQPKTGQLACFPCQAGHFANSSGATSCQPCAAGHFAPRQGAAVCSVCPPGHQQPQAGQSACIPDYIVAMQRNIDDVLLLMLKKNKYQQQTIEEEKSRNDRQQDQIKVLQEKIDDQEQKIYDQQQKTNNSMNLEAKKLNKAQENIKGQKMEIEGLKAENKDQKKEIEEQVTIVYNIKNDIVNINKAMVRKNQIVQGTKYCLYSPGSSESPQIVYVNFGRTYAKPPKVFLSVKHALGAPHGRGDNNNVIEADQVTTTGFRLTCALWNKMHTLAVYWIAFPNA